MRTNSLLTKILAGAGNNETLPAGLSISFVGGCEDIHGRALVDLLKTKRPDAPKCKTTLVPGLGLSNFFPISPKALVRLAAANASVPAQRKRPATNEK